MSFFLTTVDTDVIFKTLLIHQTKTSNTSEALKNTKDISEVFPLLTRTSSKSNKLFLAQELSLLEENGSAVQKLSFTVLSTALEAAFEAASMTVN